MSKQLARQIRRRAPSLWDFDRDMNSFFRPFESVFREFDRNMPMIPGEDQQGGRTFLTPSVDIKELDNKYEIVAEMPGLRRENIDIQLDEENKTITLKGETKQEKEDKNENYVFRERSFGSFQRTFAMPDNAKLEDIRASIKDGLLKLDIPKLPQLEKKASSTRKIEILDEKGENVQVNE